MRKNKRNLVTIFAVFLTLTTLGGLFLKQQYKQAKIKEARIVLNDEKKRIENETNSLKKNSEKIKTELKEIQTKKENVESKLSEKKSNIENLEKKKKELEDKLGGGS